MRKMGLLASAAALVVGGSMAKADFVISSSTVDLSVANAAVEGNGLMSGFDAIFLYAKNNGANGTGTKLNSVQVTLTDHTAGNNLVIGGYTRSSPLATSTAELIASTEVNPNGSAYLLAGTQLNTSTQPPYYSVVTVLGDPTNSSESNQANVLVPPSAYTPTNTFPNYGYAIHSFSVSVGSSIQGVNATTANGGLGALFAVVVLPHGDAVDYSGTLSGNIGNGSAISGSTAVPEPVTAGLFGIGLAGLAARRRRQA